VLDYPLTNIEKVRKSMLSQEIETPTALGRPGCIRTLAPRFQDSYRIDAANVILPNPLFSCHICNIHMSAGRYKIALFIVSTLSTEDPSVHSGQAD